MVHSTTSPKPRIKRYLGISRPLTLFCAFRAEQFVKTTPAPIDVLSQTRCKHGCFSLQRVGGGAICDLVVGSLAKQRLMMWKLWESVVFVKKMGGGHPMLDGYGKAPLGLIAQRPEHGCFSLQSGWGSGYTQSGCWIALRPRA